MKSTSNPPKLSIITINHNNKAGLIKTVESVINQTYQDYEYIVIDGCSTDGSVAYLEEQQAHFDYWVSEPDQGIYNAMNKGINVANGEYCLFLNSGDTLFDNKVLDIFMTNGKEDFIYGNVEIENEGIRNYTQNLTFKTFFLEIFVTKQFL